MKTKILIPLLFVLLISTSGCYLLETKTDSATGKETTNLEAILTKVNTGIEAGAPIVSAFVPGVKTIAGLAVGFLSLIGGTITSIVVAKRRGGTLAAVIKGVEIAGDGKTKTAIKYIAGALGYEPALNKLVKSYFPTKS